MDPYIVLEHRNIKYKGEPDPEGHTEPIWKENMELPIFSMEEDIKISVLDQGIIRDECIGSNTFPVSHFLENSNSEFSIPILHK